MEEARPADADRLGDLVQRRPLVAVLGEETEADRKDLLAR
jgi:hypothetical protein